MTDDERERRIRVRNARHATPDCLCDWCFILGRLDAERKRGGIDREQMVEKVARVMWEDAWSVFPDEQTIGWDDVEIKPDWRRSASAVLDAIFPQANQTEDDQ